jgi:hypothetical protein
MLKLFTDILQASPRLRFNREGSLLAVTTSDNGIKILANTDGQRLLRMLESRAFEGSRGPPQQINTKVVIYIILFHITWFYLHLFFCHNGNFVRPHEPICSELQFATKPRQNV